MSYRRTMKIGLLPSDTGLTLHALLVDQGGATVGTEISTGFVELGVGNYSWDYSAFPDGFRGSVKFYTGTLPTGLQATATIDPLDGEGLPAAVWEATSRTLTGFGTLIVDIWAGATQAFFAKFVTQDTGKTADDVVAGSVVGLSQGDGVVSDITEEALAKFANTDTGVSSPVAGSVAKLSQGTGLNDAQQDQLDNIEDQTSRLIGGRVVMRSPILQDGEHLVLVAGDDYTSASGDPLEWQDEGGNWPTITGATIVLTVRDKITNAVMLTKSGTVVVGTGEGKTVRVQPTRTNTSELVPGDRTGRFDVQATLTTGEVKTLVRGDQTTLAQYTES